MTAREPPRLAPRFLGPPGRPTIVADRAETVLAATGRSPRLDPLRAWHVLALSTYDVAHGLLADVGLVPMHHVVTPGPDGVLEVRPGVAPPRIAATEAEAVRRVRDVLLDTVEDAVRPARRVAVLLSGGTDSSAIAAALVTAWRRLDRRPADLLAVHVGPPPDAGPGEEPAARAVAQALGLPFHRQTFDACADPFADCEDFFRANDLPSDDGGFAPARRRFEEVRDLGFDTVLTGDGGDEVFAGWWMRPWRRPTAWATAAALGDHVARSVARPVRNALTGRRGALRRALAAGGVPGWLAQRRPPGPPPTDYPRTRSGLRGAAARREASTRCARQGVLAAWWDAWERVLEVRFRCPILDPRVLDLGVALPQGLFVPRPVERRLLRSAFADLLPAAMSRQGKESGDAMEVLRREVATHGRGWIERYVAGGALESAGLGPGTHGEELLASAAAGSPAGIYRVLAYASLGAWCRARGL